MRIDDDRIRFGFDISSQDLESKAAEHFSDVDGTLELEAAGEALVADGYPDDATAEFVRRVCRWGKYSDVWGRVLKNNSPAEIRAAFTSALEALAAPAHDLARALACVNRLHGLGSPSFASKHLRFLAPGHCPVFDDVLRTVLPYSYTPSGYAQWGSDCAVLAKALTSRRADNPWRDDDRGWLPPDAEAAVFQWARTRSVD